MKVTLEHKDGEYILLVEYRYSNLTDALFGQALVFEPNPRKVTKPRKVVKMAKKQKKFPLGNAILRVLPKHNESGVTMEYIMTKAKTPRTFGKSIWGAVMGKLVKKGLVQVNKTPNGDGIVYRKKQ